MQKSCSSSKHKNTHKKQKGKVPKSLIQVAHINLMAVSARINNVRPTTNIINSKCLNRQVVMSTSEGGLYLLMLPDA